ncbi:hypothetical protein FACS1894140_4690 [Spirochaetia bacterium]|nr:hypothetical protein FACS1894140_4690 [Spirochaetia bacterium]
MAAKFEIFTDKSKQYRFRLKASNGEIIATGEAYPTKAAAIKGIASIQKNAPTAKINDPEAKAEETAKKAAAKAKAKKPSAKTGAKKAGRPPKAK